MIVQENLNEKVSQPRLCQGTNEFRGISWDELENRFIYSTFQIFLKKQEIYYIKEGQIIRLDTIKDETKEPDYLTNLDQIKFLNWIGSCDKKNQKIGKWITIWKGGVLQGIGGYYAEGEKQGLWKEISKNFQNQAQIYEYGEYMNDKRQGIWKHLYKQTEIGGGRYNPLGQRHGKWIQASDSFWDQSNITYIGVYENGIKIGLWDIQFNEKGIDYLVGGGFYDQGVKVGHWVDIFDGFWFHSCITYHGEYNKGKKIGNWNSFWDARSKIGGGSYDEGIKIGNWIEVSDGIFDQSIVTFMGEYNKGQKIGRWETLFSDKGNIQWMQDYFQKQLILLVVVENMMKKAKV
ncbi:unnamed protein product [Paramecium octaurelia]|uniref:Uncharacterized protein n=1 Tax=Paramecium octaurelia TaxID=43137 RepID=A0A8S1U2A2_PAROT|nr:unnamed protein product [Paramecium octaurelia]